jgi:nucleotide-binding universal stress UspA family protein
MNRYRVVVGVDGSDGGDRALRWAFREAHGRGGTVHAVIAWLWNGIDSSMISVTSPIEQEAQAAMALTGAVAAVAADYPDTPLSTEVVEGTPASALTRAAADADLLVLGSHGHGRVYHAVLGSVAEACIRAATCPVVVVPVPHAERAHKPAGVGTDRRRPPFNR